MRRRRRPNGTVVDVRTAPLPTGGYISVVTDITPLTLAEAELSRRAEEMAAMLASIRHGVLLWGADRRLIASNAAVVELMNHPPGLLTPGRTQDEILDNMVRRGEFGDDSTGRAIADGLRARDRSMTYIRTLRLRTGRLVEIRSDPIPGGGWVSTYTDVTEARAAEEELRRAMAAAETANQAKSRFLATMSHELRTPLNSVIGFSDALLREAPNPAPARVAEFARQINDSGRNLLNLINIILDVARIEAGRFDLATDVVDVDRLVRTAVRQADAACPGGRGHAGHRDGRPLAPAARRRTAAGTGAAPPALKRREVHRDRRHRHRRRAIWSRMGGCWYSCGTPGSAFGPRTWNGSLSRSPNSIATLARRYQGSGLGLYVSRALVAGHGGRLTLTSRAGEGTMAEIRLPATQLVEDAGR